MSIDGLTEVQRTGRHSSHNEKWEFGEGDVREALKKVYSSKKSYVLFQTIANKVAAEALKQYVGFRKDMESPWEVRKIQNGDDPHYVPGANDNCNGLEFDNRLMDCYQGAIDKIANRLVGKSNFSYYPLVSTDGIHSLDRDPKAIFWPIVYIVSDEKQAKLKEIIDKLSEDESFEVIKKSEAPQFYQMGEIETLHKLKIPPLVRLEREFKASAKDLLMYIDFFAQMTESYQWTGPVVNEDL